jgi:acyl carrier protein
MDKKELENLIIEKVKEVSFKKVSPGENLFKDGIIDSITLVDLSVSLEESLNIKIPFFDLNEQNFSTVEKIADYLLVKSKASV